jgi:hypothetical protein
MSQDIEELRLADLSNLPGFELVQQGLKDLESGTESIAALLVLIGYPRLRQLGVVQTLADDLREAPENRLYQLLAREIPVEAYGRYNAFIRQLVSFERACEHRLQRRAKK